MRLAEDFVVTIKHWLTVSNRVECNDGKKYDKNDAYKTITKPKNSFNGNDKYVVPKNLGLSTKLYYDDEKCKPQLILFSYTSEMSTRRGF